MNKVKVLFLDPENLPENVRSLVSKLEIDSELIEANAKISIDRLPFNRLPWTQYVNPEEWSITHVVDENGLYRTTFYDEGQSYNIRIEGRLPFGTRERVMGYDESELKTVYSSEQHRKIKPYTPNGWRILGKKR